MFYSIFTINYNQLQNRVGVKTQTVSRFLRQNYKIQKCRKGNTSARAYARTLYATSWQNSFFLANRPRAAFLAVLFLCLAFVLRA